MKYPTNLILLGGASPHRNIPAGEGYEQLVFSRKDDPGLGGFVTITINIRPATTKSIRDLNLMNSEYTTLGSYEALKLLGDPVGGDSYILIQNMKEYTLDSVGDRTAAYQILSTFRFVE